MRNNALLDHEDHLLPVESSTMDLNAMRSMHNLQSAFTIAKKFPRDESQAVQNILNACKRISLASAGIYSYPKGKTEVRGASIRLAETIARHWGNLDCGVREIKRSERSSLVESFCIDLETNTRKSLEFEVQHEMETKQGMKRLTDPRDIYEHIANMGARRLRACIQAAIPLDVFEAAVEACEKTINDENRTKPIADRVRLMVSAFDKLGVKVEHLEKRLGHKLDMCIDSELTEYKAIHNSIKDNMTTREAWFEMQPVQVFGKGMAGFKSLIGIESVEVDGNNLTEKKDNELAI